MKRAALCLLPFSLLACTHIDTGQADYRIAENATTASRVTSGNGVSTGCSTHVNFDCPLLLSRVIRRFDPGPTPAYFSANDRFSIEIEQGMIGSNILEGNILGRQMGHNAEIAILANVFEFAPANATDAEAAERRFLETGELSTPNASRMKLIYFSDDVERYQPFSFNHLPVLPVSQYQGRSIGIQIIVMEVDAQSGPIATLMETLAGFGQEVIPGPPGLRNMVFDLGKSLTAGGGDDRLFDYRFVLSPALSNRTAPQAAFAPGRYILRRGQARAGAMDWTNVQLDHNSMRLMRVGSQSGEWEEVRDELYLVVNIENRGSGAALERYPHQGWTEARAAIERAAAAESPSMDGVQQALIGAISGQRRSDLAEQWARADGHLRDYASLALQGLDGNTFGACQAEADRRRERRDNKARDAQDAIRLFLAGYRTAARQPAAQPPAPAPPEMFTEADREALVSFVARSFMPWTEAVPGDKFASAAAFQTAFVQGNEDLAGLALTRALARARTGTTCADLAR